MFRICLVDATKNIINADKKQICDHLMLVMNNMAKAESLIPVPINQGGATALEMAVDGVGLIGACGPFVVYVNGHKQYSAYNHQTGYTVDTQINSKDREYAKARIANFVNSLQSELPQNRYGFQQPQYQPQPPPPPPPQQIAAPSVSVLDAEIAAMEEMVKKQRLEALKKEAAAQAAPAPTTPAPRVTGVNLPMPSINNIVSLVILIMSVLAGMQSGGQHHAAPVYHTPRADVARHDSNEHMANALQAMGTMFKGVVDSVNLLAERQSQMVAAIQQSAFVNRNNNEVLSDQHYYQEQPKRQPTFNGKVAVIPGSEVYGSRNKRNEEDDNSRWTSEEEEEEYIPPTQKRINPTQKRINPTPPPPPPTAPPQSESWTIREWIGFSSFGLLVLWVSLVAFVRSEKGGRVE